MTNCIVCDKSLKAVHDDGAFPWQTYGGVMVEILGNYGSRVYEKGFSEKERIYAVICDKCMTERLSSVFVVPYQRPPRPEYVKVESWDEVDRL